MAMSFIAVSNTGRNLFATVQQIQSNGTLGDHWDNTNSVFAAVVPIADRKIQLTEGGVNDAGKYVGGVGTLAAYTGYVLKSVHDANQSNRVIGAMTSWVESGVEVRIVNTGDITNIATDVRTELNNNPVPASNMRGTDNAFLAASYTAPDNAGIANAEADAATAAAQATTAAAQAAASATDAATLITRLTAGRATNLDNLDAAITTRSTLTAPQVQVELTNNPVPSSNMRGTDNALLAASYTAPDNATITSIAGDATSILADTSALDSRLTATRAGYLDNLSAGPVATQASVNNINNSVRSKIITAAEAQVPPSGSEIYTVDILLYDADGNMEDADATPALTAANQNGTDRSVNLSTVTRVSQGYYTATYTITSAHAVERITFTASYTENAVPLIAKQTMAVVAEASGGGFTTSDRSSLTAIFDKLPSKAYLTGTTASDGDIDVTSFDGDLTTLHADTSLLATAASITALPGSIQTELTNNPVPSSNMRGTDAALLAANYTAPDNATIATINTNASTAATQSTTAATQASTAATNSTTLIGRLTTARADNLDNLDAAITSRSDFDETTDFVVLAAGHGLATANDQALIKAKTDLIPSSPAATSDIPTASQIATQVNSTLETAHGVGQWDATSDATLANQQSIIASIGGIVADPPSAIVVAKARTWTIEHGTEDDRAPQIVTLSSGTAATLAMDFSSALNDETAISTVATVTDISGEGGTLTINNKLPSQDRQKAHFDVSALETGKRYEIEVVVATSDQQTLTGKGILRVD